jgi:GT2 family glycosyltransferase
MAHVETAVADTETTSEPSLVCRPDGVLTGRIAAGVKPGGSVGLWLDGTWQGSAPCVADGGGASAFAWPLPRHLLFGALDLVALPGGASLLAAPWTMAGCYGVELGPVTLHKGLLRGSFTAAPWLGPDLGVELMADGVVAARGLAMRIGPAASWHFALQPAALPRPGQILELTARIGGLLLDTPAASVAAEEFGFLGCLDAASPHHVQGWAVAVGDPHERVALDVLVDARLVATITAGEARDDLRTLGLGDGNSAFDAPLPPHPDPTAKRVIAVRLAGTATHLVGSPFTIDPVPGLAGMFDTLHGMAAHGWALDRTRPGEPVVIDIVGPEGEILGSGPAHGFRGDLLDAGLAGGLCAFKIDIAPHFERLLGHDIVARVAGTNLVLPGSPIRVSINRNLLRFLHRRQNLPPGVLPRLKRALNYRARGRGISFIMPVHDTPRAWLIEALESVRQQFCDAWELICVDDGSTLPHVQEVLASYAARERRVRVLTSRENVGIARAVNFGLRAARYDHVAVMDHDDTIEPDCAWQFLRAAAETGADLLYSDEALTDENIGSITEFRLRPAFSHDYYLSHPYFVHMVCVRTDVARTIGGWDEGLKISADVDFVLRVLEAANTVAHVPGVLYRWRTHGSSTGHARKAEVTAATIGALQRHLDRLGTGARVGEGVWFNQYRVDWPDTDALVLIVIPTRNRIDLLRTAVSSIERTASGCRYRLVVIDHESDDEDTLAYLGEIAGRHRVMRYEGPFNFSAMNNLAVARHGGDAAFVLFLNNDVEATQQGWIARLRSLAARPDIGAVGALLMYEDRRVQHAGVVLGFNDSADHALKFQNLYLDSNGRRNLGYNCSLTATRDFSAVTGACLMLRKSVFDELGGFDETMPIGFNDTDLCLRIRAAGYRILYDGATILYHYESATRSLTQQVFHPEDTATMIGRWGDTLRAGDPFYHPNLSLVTQDHVPREDAGARVMNRPRVTTLRPSIKLGGLSPTTT